MLFRQLSLLEKDPNLWNGIVKINMILLTKIEDAMCAMQITCISIEKPLDG